jgi:phosphatidylserine decarboxylase
MEKQSKEDLLKIKEYLLGIRDFYKRILLEEYRKTHPNSYRYKDADEKIAQINVKGKLLKSIIDSK